MQVHLLGRFRIEDHSVFETIFFVTRIELTKNHQNIPHDFKHIPSNTYNFLFEADLNIIRDQSIIQVVINYQFYFNDHTLLDLQSENDFRVTKIDEILIEGKLKSDNFTFFFVDLATTHMRGMQALVQKDTAISRLFMPFIDKTRMLARLNINTK